MNRHVIFGTTTCGLVIIINKFIDSTCDGLCNYNSWEASSRNIYFLCYSCGHKCSPDSRGTCYSSYFEDENNNNNNYHDEGCVHVYFNRNLKGELCWPRANKDMRASRHVSNGIETKLRIVFLQSRFQFKLLL